MSNPTISFASPANGATGVVLGLPIVVTFNTLMDHSTINAGSFALQAPGNTQIITPTQEIQKFPVPSPTKVSVPGAYSFDDTAGYTVATFTPSIPLSSNTTYKVVLLGNGTITAGVGIKDVNGNQLDQTYGWSFTTGTLNLTVPPVQSPIIVSNPDLNPCDIVVIPRKFVLGQDLTQEIDLIFPAPINQNSFDPEEMLLAVEPILGDPSVLVPPGLQTTVTIQGNRMKILITGWPA
jgi:hypothetical protein